MNILTCSDQENLKFVKTMFASLFDSNRVPMDLFLCYSGQDCNMLKDVERFAAGEKDKQLHVIKTEEANWISALPLLDESIEKILFLDSRVIVKGGIDDLYGTDLTDRYMAVCDDISNRIKGTLTDEVAFDEGVILLNIGEIRKNNDTDLAGLTEDRLIWKDWSLYDCPPAYYYMDLESAKKGELRFLDYDTIKKESTDAERFSARYTNITKQIADSAKIINYTAGTCPADSDREDAEIYQIFDRYFKAWDESMLLRPERLSDEEIRQKIEEGQVCREIDGIYLSDFIRVSAEFSGKNGSGSVGALQKHGEQETNGERIWKYMSADKSGGSVLFLPYKASMWDSLETVYDAAKADKAWDVTVSVIPYYDRPADGDRSLKPENMHCEVGEFPDDLDITDYRSLDLENRRFDMIFIHNPYDQYNHVTSIAPEFYSRKVKEHTDKLVYIPYFVHNNEGVGRLSATTPGVVFSDYTVVVSEKVRQQYIQFFREGIPGYEEHAGAGSIEKKFVVLGSPKYDIKFDPDKLPQEWKDKAYRDGRKKTVIFFNTHLDSIMSVNAVSFFGKLKRIFDMAEGNDDILLLWRPHPLMVQTAQSLNPAAVEPYLRLIDDFKERNIGIFDDTPDFHRALAFSDICYGDGGSTPEFFRQMKKPMLYFCREM